MVTYANSGWAALSDPTRRAVFELLVKRPRAVSDLAEALPVSRPAVSQHLKVLKNVGLVLHSPSGKHRIYRVDPAGLERLRAELDRFWSKTLASYKKAAERSAEDPE